MFLGGCALEAVSLLWRNEYKYVSLHLPPASGWRSTHDLGEEQLESKFKVALNRMSISWTW